MHTKIQSLMNEEMSRKDFLLRVAGIVLVVVGVSGMLQKLQSSDFKTKGYGSSAYGGSAKAN